MPGNEIVPFAGGWLMWSLTRFGGCYAAMLLALLVAQRALIFPRPTADMLLDPTREGGRLISAGDARALYFPAGPGKSTLLYFHGNGDQIGGAGAYLGSRLNSNDGLGFVGIEYPGYGVAPGSPSEAACVDAAMAIVEHLEAAHGLPRRELVVFGQSIGCAIALNLVTSGVGQRLVLLSPFASLYEMAGTAFPIAKPALRLLPFLLRDKLDNLSRARHVRIPTLVIHGSRDEIVPYEQGERLASLIPGARFIGLPMGHNDVFSPPHGHTVLKHVRSFAQVVHR